jgi:hypothetical protein
MHPLLPCGLTRTCRADIHPPSPKSKHTQISSLGPVFVKSKPQSFVSKGNVECAVLSESFPKHPFRFRAALSSPKSGSSKRRPTTLLNRPPSRSGHTRSYLFNCVCPNPISARPHSTTLPCLVSESPSLCLTRSVGLVRQMQEGMSTKSHRTSLRTTSKKSFPLFASYRPLWTTIAIYYRRRLSLHASTVATKGR